jgi:glycine/D-amino acid oxidase-like deaminating enzyme
MGDLHVPTTWLGSGVSMFSIKSDKSYDIVVVGNGAVGSALAYELRRRDAKAKIAIVGPAARRGCATVTAGAMINVWAEISKGQFDDPALADRGKISIESFDLWDPWCEALSEYAPEPLSVKWGTYVINNALGSPHEVATVDYQMQVMQERGIEYRVCNVSDVPWLKPEIHAQISRIVRVPDGRIDPRQVLAAYEAFFRAKDVAVFDTTVTGIKVGNNLLRSIGTSAISLTLADGTNLSAGQVVLANGTFAQELIDQIPDVKRATPRLVWGAGSGLDLSLPPWIHKYGGLDRSIFDIDHVVRTVDRGGACGVHLVPYGNGEYYLGASSGVWFEPEWKPRVHAVHVLLRSLAEEINGAFFFATFSMRGPGFRPTAIDGLPLLGETSRPGVWLANGTKRDGFTMSPLIARELANAILGGKSLLPARFLPTRNVISYKNRTAAIDDGVTGDFGGEVQHGLRLPPYAVEPYRAAKRAKIEAIYEKRKIVDFGIHPEMVHLYENDDFFAAIDHPRERA